MEDPNILDLDGERWNSIMRMLDNMRTREVFLAAVDEQYFDSTAREILETQGNRSNTSPGKWLLQHLGSQEVRVSDFIKWFESANLERGLMLLKKEIPLRIIEQPPSKVILQVGENLIITCRASGYPLPEYQWFKENERLLVQQDPELIIDEVTSQDSGKYCCRVSKQVHESADKYNWLFSEIVEVIVLDDIPSMLSSYDQEFPEINTLSSLSSYETSEVVCVQDTEEKLQHFKIVITQQPQEYAKVCQGFPFYLTCVAAFPGPIRYQWYKNGRILNGANTSELHLSNMYPDETGSKFQYFCVAWNDYDTVCSSHAIVELEEVNANTRYFAEEKVALLIANDSYEVYEPLKTPATDAADLAKLLREIHFKVYVFRNLTLEEMNIVLHAFFSIIKVNTYALFFFAGHGFELPGQTYIQPTDCSELRLPTESICTEYILERMQEKEPAVNVLLIDACRKMPPQKNHLSEMYKIYDAHMKRNTVYGYSTPFLSASYESEERNSFFVKHLKKYIAQDKSIDDVIILVKRAFEGERFVNNHQTPMLKSTLTVPRKLCDTPEDPANFQYYDYLCEKRKPIEIFNPDLQCTFIIDIKHHMDIFYNAVDVFLNIAVGPSADRKKLNFLEINIGFNLLEVQVEPSNWIYLKDMDLKMNSKYLLLKRTIIGTQRIKDKKMKGSILIVIRPPQNSKLQTRQIEIPFSFKVGKTQDNVLLF